MGNYPVTRACGHTELMQMPDSHAERRKHRALLAQHVCARCKIEAQQLVDPLPPLDGTYRQVAWAASIRFEQAKAWRKQREALPDDPLLDQALALIETQLSAKWWIEHRITSLELVARELGHTS
jgi:hypothetical protein